MFFRFGGRDVHMPRLIGAFILFAALLFFLQASAQMFASWDNLKEVNKCLATPEVSRSFCQEFSRDALNVYVSSSQEELSTRQFWGVILGPIGSILLWLAVLFFGLLIYRTGDLVIPIEESIRVLKEKKH